MARPSAAIAATGRRSPAGGHRRHDAAACARTPRRRTGTHSVLDRRADGFGSARLWRPDRQPATVRGRVTEITDSVGGEVSRRCSYESAIGVEVHSVHVPPGSTNGWIKVEILEGIARGDSRRHLLATGSARRLQHSSTRNSRGRDRYLGAADQGNRIVLRERMRAGTGPRWDAAERGDLTGNLKDVFRTLHGFGVDEGSWFLTRGGKTVVRRFDHIMVPDGIRAIQCEYRHEWRLAGLSDHSAIETVLEFGEGA